LFLLYLPLKRVEWKKHYNELKVWLPTTWKAFTGWPALTWPKFVGWLSGPKKVSKGIVLGILCLITLGISKWLPGIFFLLMFALLYVWLSRRIVDRVNTDIKEEILLTGDSDGRPIGFRDGLKGAFKAHWYWLAPTALIIVSMIISDFKILLHSQGG
jgi:hypothetical protein